MHDSMSRVSIVLNKISIFLRTSLTDIKLNITNNMKQNNTISSSTVFVVEKVQKMFQIPKKRSRIVQSITPFHDWLPSRAITALFKVFLSVAIFHLASYSFKTVHKKLHRYWMCTAPRCASENQWCGATTTGIQAQTTERFRITFVRVLIMNT